MQQYGQYEDGRRYQSMHINTCSHCNLWHCTHTILLYLLLMPNMQLPMITRHHLLGTPPINLCCLMYQPIIT